MATQRNSLIDKVVVKPYYAGMRMTMALLGLITFAILINIPLGYLRRNYEKFTFGWYFYVHMSIPAIIYIRVKTGLSWKFIPLTLAGAIVGQLLGSKLFGKRSKDD
jgi:hypothetical protein